MFSFSNSITMFFALTVDDGRKPCCTALRSGKRGEDVGKVHPEFQTLLYSKLQRHWKDVRSRVQGKNLTIVRWYTRSRPNIKLFA